MGKTYKIALALLYAAQVVMIYREAAAHLYNRTVESAIEKQNDVSRQAYTGDPRAKLRSGVRLDFLWHGLLTAAFSPARLAPLRLDEEVGQETSHEHPPEKQQYLVKKPRWRRAREYLIANLLPGLMRSLPPATPVLPNFSLTSRNCAVSFPAAD